MSQLVTPKSKFPEFEATLLSGGSFSLDDARPEKFLIIAVYRGLHCPKCKKQLQDLEGRVDDIRADGHAILAVSMDNEERARQAKTDWEIENLPMAYGLNIPDAKRMGLFLSDAISDKEPTHFSEPALFVLRPDGSLYAQIVQNTPFGRPDMGDLIAGLNYAFENDYPVRGTSVA